MTNTMARPQNLDPDPDVISIVLRVVRTLRPDITSHEADQIKRQLQTECGGRRLYFPKGGQRLTPEKRAAVYQDGLSSMDNREIVAKHQVSRATIYRLMKDGGGRFS
ncbi:hypothetical protein LHU53_12415 [Rhodoferax sp. U2-2l]|uniref:Mor transcription activator family protein n=1 Tax=Rhodoferax sp. U2-2l TaxID=2884000 RepID=UPI001D0B3167|nr:Mor transcription activator family protein [Rhodoferax sp. U2-2l]MCB8747708.1 hypothetical protein [Rhodoferax sp. U2-2l]